MTCMFLEESNANRDHSSQSIQLWRIVLYTHTVYCVAFLNTIVYTSSADFKAHLLFIRHEKDLFSLHTCQNSRTEEEGMGVNEGGGETPNSLLISRNESINQSPDWHRKKWRIPTEKSICLLSSTSGVFQLYMS